MIIDRQPAQVFVDENEGLKILDEAFAEEEYAIAVAKDNTELLDKVNAALGELKESGKLDEIIGKYISRIIHRRRYAADPPRVTSACMARLETSAVLLCGKESGA